ncbi:VOC family protein [Alphaproteobacteria bacterium LSUCC0719]|jgi:predicted enzyme related to lactoylglutathione lyase
MKFFFEIFARDLALSRAFYADAIGLTVRQESPAFIVMERGQAKIHLVSRDHLPVAQRRRGCNGMPTACAVELCFEVPDIIKAHELARRSGHPVVEPLRDQPWGRSDFRMFDPDGVYVRVTGHRPVAAS